MIFMPEMIIEKASSIRRPAKLLGLVEILYAI